ncbi:MAG: DUF493 domain-containing protein [Owenweeksia sp.]
MTDKEREEKYKKLEAALRESLSWPNVYMFKFIIPADNRILAQVENLFNSKEAEIKGNFLSITVKELMMSPEKVIERYQMAEGIEGLMSL